jgi:ubiquinone/menaquinone biosynthesis C-methylase UbiE
MNGPLLNDSYEPFSREPEYIEVNRLFIENLNLSPGTQVLDLACGTGTLSALLLEQLDRKRAVSGKCGSEPLADIIGADLSLQSLKLAKEYLGEFVISSRHRVHWMQASAEQIPLPSACVKVVMIGNAIQLFENKPRVVREVARVLVDGGTLAFNTSFYAGCYVPGTERVYLRWVQEAISYINKKNAELRRQGEIGAGRKKGTTRPAFSNPWLSPRDYKDLLARNGFEVTGVKQRTVLLTQRSLETIGAYAGLAGILLSGYPLGLACEALAAAAEPTLQAFSLDSVPRYWIEFVAVKCASARADHEYEGVHANVSQ